MTVKIVSAFGLMVAFALIAAALPAYAGYVLLIMVVGILLIILSMVD